MTRGRRAWWLLPVAVRRRRRRQPQLAHVGRAARVPRGRRLSRPGTAVPTAGRGVRATAPRGTAPPTPRPASAGSSATPCSSRSARWPSRSSSARCSPGRPVGCRAGWASCASCRSCRSSCPRWPTSSAGRSCSRPGPATSTHYLRMLPWWNHLTEGPIDIYTMPWIVILTGFGLTSFVYLFVSAGFANISAEHLEAAQVAGSSTWGVFFKVILPLLRPTLIYGGGVALLLGLGQFTAPLLLGRNSGIDVITTNMYSAMTAYPTQYGTAAALGSPLLLLGIVIVVVPEVPARQPAPLRHPQRPGVPSRGQGIQARRTGDHAVQHDGHDPADRCTGDRLADPVLVGEDRAEQVHPGQLPHAVRHEHDHRRDQEQRVLRGPRRAHLAARRASSPPTSCCG